MDRLSLRTSTTASPDMKSLSTSPTKTPALEGPLAGFIGAACLRSGGDIAFQALRAEYGAPEVPFALNSPSRRPPRCSTVVFPAFMSPEIATKLALTEATTPATQKPWKKAISYHLSPHPSGRPARLKEAVSNIRIGMDPCLLTMAIPISWLSDTAQPGGLPLIHQRAPVSERGQRRQ